METISAATQEDSSGANPSSVKSDDSSPRHESGRGSPPPNCAICLGTCRNKSFTDSCLHQFCFKCLLTWSKVKAECPLCKQNFKSIIHNVRSNHQYEEYMVEQRTTEEVPEGIDLINSSIMLPTRRFRYRTTLTLPRSESLAIQQLLLHYPLMAGVLAGSGGAVGAGGAVGGGAAVGARRRRSPASFRRTVYRHNLWARPLPDFTGRFRDCSPQFYRYNDSQMHRLVPWLDRELHYLLNENEGHISYVMARILELLPQYHINSSEFREAMFRYFGDRTEHFLHELYCFASTPYDMTGYDRNVQYTTDTRISTMINEIISSSESEASVDSDIMMVSSSEPTEVPPGPSRPNFGYPLNVIPTPSTDNIIPIETISQSDTDDDSSEVMVVGCIKAPQDRTPEVVDLLGSDSDVIVQDNVQPVTSQNTEQARESRPAPLVKLRLKRQWTRTEDRETDSDESSYTPPLSKRKKRFRSNGTATTADTCRTTPSPARQTIYETIRCGYESNSSSSLTSDVSSFYTDSSYASSDSRGRRSRTSRRKPTRRAGKETGSGRTKKKNKKRPGPKDGKSSQSVPSEKDKRGKRKSYSGKGVKSSKKSTETVAASEPQGPSDPTQPGPSGSSHAHKRKSSKERKRRQVGRDNKRLKSVVNVMYSHKNSGASNSSGDASHSLSVNPSTVECDQNCDSEPSGARINKISPESTHVERQSELRTASRGTVEYDSEDDLPLNLTVQKTYH